MSGTSVNPGSGYHTSKQWPFSLEATVYGNVRNITKNVAQQMLLELFPSKLVFPRHSPPLNLTYFPDQIPDEIPPGYNASFSVVEWLAMVFYKQISRTSSAVNIVRPDLSRSGQGISSPDVVSRLGRKFAPSRTHAQNSSNSRRCGSPLGHLPSSCRSTFAHLDCHGL